MSRIGNKAINLPAGVTVTVAEGNLVTVKGPKGELSFQFNNEMQICVEGAQVLVKRPNDTKEAKTFHGTTRAVLNNMIVGVSEGFKKQLDINGVGYRVAKEGNKLVMNLGFSHQVIMEEKEGISIEVPNPNTIVVKGINKQAVGQIAAVIRGKRPPEPYHGKGVKYSDEHIRRKAGKAGKS